MRAMTKSAVLLAREALSVGRKALSRYSSRFSRRNYTQAQFFALLVLKQILSEASRSVLPSRIALQFTPLRAETCGCAHPRLRASHGRKPEAPSGPGRSPGWM